MPFCVFLLQNRIRELTGEASRVVEDSSSSVRHFLSVPYCCCTHWRRSEGRKRDLLEDLLRRDGTGVVP